MTLKVVSCILGILAPAILRADDGNVWKDPLPYDRVSSLLWLCRSKTDDGVKYVPLYLHLRKGFDLSVARFRIVSPNGESVPLSVESVTSIAAAKRPPEVSMAVKRGCSAIVWLPKDKQKYKAWQLRHDVDPDTFSFFLFGRQWQNPFKNPNKPAHADPLPAPSRNLNDNFNP